ncbi:hypothetical protein HDV00_000310 [Rhizophlyctis rosea]|nr:hypothetical protein HDV00_000310 [Rhizophlyctis rosea]
MFRLACTALLLALPFSDCKPIQSLTIDTDHLDLNSVRTGIPRYAHKPSPPPSNPRIFSRATSPSTDLNVTFNCDRSLTVEICQSAESSLMSTLTRITNVIYLPQGLTVNFTFGPYCNPSLPDPTSCGAKKGNTLGSAYPASYHTFPAGSGRKLGIDESYAYPRSLVRQYAPSSLTYGDIDIQAQLNSDANWWFPSTASTSNSSATTSASNFKTGDAQMHSDLWQPRSLDPSEGSKSNVYDFSQIALHEILHGLGFFSSWAQGLGGEALLPFSITIDDSGNATLGMKYIFNKFLADATTGTWMKDYEAQIAKDALGVKVENIARSMNAEVEWKSRFFMTEGGRISQRLRQETSVTPGAVRFYYPVRWNGSKDGTDGGFEWRYANIHTPRNFSGVSSLSHLDSNYYDATTQFVMRSGGTPGAGLDAFMPGWAADGMEGVGPIGEVVLQIMRAMGYATALGPL